MGSADLGQSGGQTIEDVASGQRLIILAVLVNIVAAVLQAAVHPSFALLGLVGAVVAIVGLLRLGRGLDYSTATKVVLIVLSFVPLVNLVMLLIVNSRATKALRSAGYEVGFFGVRQ